MRLFQFKQFQVTDEHSSMKVGIDSVLLGAWVSIDKVTSVMDIGSGSGLISLIMAQRIPNAQILGVEIDPNSVEDAKYNYNRSPWSDRLKIVLEDVKQYNPEQSFDLVISNPPYFKDSLHPDNFNRAEARHDFSLSLNALLCTVNRVMSPNGVFAIVFPYDREVELLSMAKQNSLFPHRILRSQNKPGAKIKRVFVEFRRSEVQDIEIEKLNIRNDINEYSPEYQRITKDFYLKF